MNRVLMHKNIPVLDVDVDTVNGRIKSIGEVRDTAHLPVGVFLGNEKDLYRFEGWWQGRSIPMSRDGLERVLRDLGVYDPSVLTVKSMGLNLSDQYWLKPKDSSVTWDDVNFFDNDFSEEMGNILFGEKHGSKDTDVFSSPDSASNGWLRKKWKITDGKRYLVKGGSGFMQEPFNEVIAAIIAEKLGFTHTDYTVEFTNKKMPVSVCECFITNKTELISAAYINRVLPFSDSESKYDHFRRCCEFLKIPGYSKSLDEMMILDHIIANQDRHMGNFGAIRNADTLEYIGFAPVYDSGTSLRYDTPTEDIVCDMDIESQPFEDFLSKQIQLVSDFGIYSPDKMQGIADEIIRVFSDKNAKEYIRADRIDKICGVVIARTGMLNEYFEKSKTHK